MEPFASYVLETFRNLYQVPEEINIFYGNDSYESITRGVRIKSGAGNFFEFPSKLNYEDIIFKEWKGTLLPFLFDDSLSPDLIEKKSGKAIIPYDIIAASFYFLSGWQEYVTQERDDYGRYPYQQSLQYRLDAAHVPFVNYYFDMLKTAVEQIYNINLSPKTIGGHPYTLVLSHDIDSVHSGWLQDGYFAFKNLKFGTLGNILLQKIFGHDRWFNLEEIVDFEKNRGVASTFFFLPLKGTSNNIKHADYALEEPGIQKIIAKIREAGSEIGLHGSFETHRSAEAFSESIQKFDGEIKGNRFHFLIFDVRRTPFVLSQFSPIYDSTLGFSEKIGFRNGFCHPFYLFDLENNCPTEVLEIPLTIMDTTLHQEKYMGLTPEEAPQYTERLLEEIKKFNGIVSILWHNSYFSDLKYQGWKEVLDQIIGGAQNDGALVTKAETVFSNFIRQI